MRRIIASPSPNHDQRPAGKAIDILLLHYTGMRDAEAGVQDSGFAPNAIGRST